MAFSKIIAESMDLSDAYNFTGTLQQNGAGIGGDNKPAFHAYANTNQTGLSDNTWVKLQMNVEDLDTDSAYDHSSNYRFTPQTAGKYLIYLHAVIFSESANQGYVFNGSIYKNGTNVAYSANNNNSSHPEYEKSMFLVKTIDFNGSSDYVEAYGRLNVLSGNWATSSSSTGTLCYFGGYKLIT